MQIADIDLKRYSNHFSSYTELRLHENTSQQIALLNGDVIANTRDTSGGVSSRVFDRGTWGFSSNANMDDEAIESTISAATRNADFLARRCGDENAGLPAARGEASSDFRTKLPRKNQEEIIAFLKSCDDYIVNTCPELVSRQVVLNSLDMEKKLYTSEGSAGHNVNTRTLISI
ncbi:MAG: TldD/PmbA family protein, partial [Proteobacteria bacterium]|nr:TldD/PmbA family protein [Pseudomonadota bacterium]